MCFYINKSNRPTKVLNPHSSFSQNGILFRLLKLHKGRERACDILPLIVVPPMVRSHDPATSWLTSWILSTFASPPSILKEALLAVRSSSIHVAFTGDARWKGLCVIGHHMLTVLNTYKLELILYCILWWLWPFQTQFRTKRTHRNPKLHPGEGISQRSSPIRE